MADMAAVVGATITGDADRFVPFWKWEPSRRSGRLPISSLSMKEAWRSPPRFFQRRQSCPCLFIFVHLEFRAEAQVIDLPDVL